MSSTPRNPPPWGLSDEEFAILMTPPTTCCDDHGIDCGYCINCPVLPNVRTMAEAHRLCGGCEGDEVAGVLARVNPWSGKDDTDG